MAALLQLSCQRRLLQPSEKDYRKAVASLDERLDEIGQDEAPPLADLAEALARFIHSYEEAHAKIREATRPEVLRSLMEAHGLTQSELPEIGSQGVASEILSSERELNVRQIRRLAKRFEVYPCRLHRRHMRAEGSDASGIKLPVKNPGLESFIHPLAPKKNSRSVIVL